MPYKRRKVEGALKRKGFEKHESDHSHFTYFTQDGKRTSVWTKTSHGAGGSDISDPLISRMAKQCQIKTQDFKQLVECPLSRQDYEKTLDDNGHL